MELLLRSSSQADICAFKKAQASVKIYCLVVRKIRRRLYRKRVIHFFIVIQARNHGQVTLDAIFQPLFSVDHFSILADCESMQYRNRVHSYKT
ncbi:hypothetical protein FQZ97_628620 [compost metagenome]